MSDEGHLNRRGLHRRLVAGLHARDDTKQTTVSDPTLPFGPTDPLEPVSASSSSSSTSSSSKSSSTSSSSSSSSKTSSSTSKSTSSSSSSSSPSTTPSSSSSSSKSTSSSSSSTSSTPSSSSRSSSSSTPVAVPTPTPTPTPTPSIASSAPVYTEYTTQSAVSSSAANAASTSNSSSVSTGVVIGGIAAGIVGVAGILFAVLYFWRRSHREDEPIEDFNAHAFRRQSVMLQDDEPPSRTPSYTRKNGFNIPPPTMMDQSMAHMPVSYGNGRAQGYGMQDGYNVYNYSGQQGYAAGQYMNMGPGQAMAGTPTSANPFMAPYSQSPIESPGAAYAEPAYDAYGRPIARQPSNGPAQYLNRQPSGGQYNGGYQAQAQPIGRQPSNGGVQPIQRQPSPPLPHTPADAHYVDLERSSVTPFQAAQYAEISRRLNAPVSDGVDTSAAAIAEDDVSAPPYDPSMRSSGVHVMEKGLPPSPPAKTATESPFTDAAAEGPSGGQEKTESIHDDLPMPPSPARSSHSRITSNPPMLPEIMQRPFSPVEYPSVHAQAFAKSSPLSNVSLPSPPPTAHLPNTPVAHPPSPTAAAEEVAASSTLRHSNGPAPKRPDTVYTLYDEDDAYGGI